MSSMKKSPLRDDTGITSLNNLNKKHAVLKFDPVEKKGRFSTNKESPLFSWYEVTLKTQGKKINKNSEEFGRLSKIMDSYSEDLALSCRAGFYCGCSTHPDDPYYSTNGSYNQSYPDLWGIHKINSSYAWIKPQDLHPS